MVRCPLVLSCILIIASALSTGNASSNDFTDWINDALKYDPLTTGVGLSVETRAFALKLIFSAIRVANFENSEAAGKTVYLANKMIENETLDANSFKILYNILSRSSIFAKNLVQGYLCQDPEEIRYSEFGGKPKNERGDNILFYIVEKSGKISRNKFVRKPDGNILMLTLGIKDAMILVENGDYPEDILTGVNIVSKNVLEHEAATRQEIDELFIKPQGKICYGMDKLYSWTVGEIDLQTQILNKKLLKEYYKKIYD